MVKKRLYFDIFINKKMPTIQELLAKLVTLSGPCPEICDGTIPLGGSGGTQTVDIRTGIPVSEYPIIEPTPSRTHTLTFVFDNITNAPVENPTNLDQWNAFFDLPANGTPFTKVTVDGNSIHLENRGLINIKPGLMYSYNYTSILLEVIDTGCVKEVGADAFSYSYGLTNVILPICTKLYGWDYSPYQDCGSFCDCPAMTNLYLPQLQEIIGNSSVSNCVALTSLHFPLLVNAGLNSFGGCSSVVDINLPSLTNADNYCFNYCLSVTGITLPSLINLGTTVGDNNVFGGIVGQNISLTIPSALMTCNGGNPDGDIIYLSQNNTLTVNGVPYP